MYTQPGDVGSHRPAVAAPAPRVVPLHQPHRRFVLLQVDLIPHTLQHLLLQQLLLLMLEPLLLQHLLLSLLLLLFFLLLL